MNLNCPNILCHSPNYKKDGFYFRANDSRRIQRFKCLKCYRRFSRSTFELEYRQKKRRVNSILFKLLASGISQRRAGIILGIHKVTVKRKFIYLAKKARQTQRGILKNYQQKKARSIQLDDLITTEHTKLKPLTVTTIVDKESRIIMAAEVASIPAFGHLAKISKKKYGYRKNDHKKSLSAALKIIKPLVHPLAIIESDEHKLYPPLIKTYLTTIKHECFKSEKGCVTGQGELKKQKRDPLFMINHTLAMFRANINRLFRRSWCTTKDPGRLKDHLDIYIAFHNTVLLKEKLAPP